MDRFDILRSSMDENTSPSDSVILYPHVAGGFLFCISPPNSTTSLNTLCIFGDGMDYQGTLLFRGILSNSPVININILYDYIEELMLLPSMPRINAIRLVGDYSDFAYEEFVQSLADLTRLRVSASRGRLSVLPIGHYIPNIAHAGIRYQVIHEEDVILGHRFYYCDPTPLTP
ncbi:hypothetical protein [Xenorhabdus lircayensis]|uniref:Uncharacterized protein n=1 Tax=Xenorhabdus lircayensis TaxID=2763499 RepID=A0ABS0U4Q2_9GAMM|nr:hypothetical protein [Xenorhabdus lircayensis]MBI6548454.1 hypothetical protein [Xenorhabdus lircayensis]